MSKVAKASIALNGNKTSPYTISFEVSIHNQSVSRSLQVTKEVAQSFAKRHNAPMPKETTNDQNE